MNKNKGFSLVELIVVVAIMAVLVGILAPAYLSYVEKTRRGTDENMAEEVRHTIEIATADICVYDEVIQAMGTGTKTYSFSNNTVIKSVGGTGTKLEEALDDVYGGKAFAIKSKKYKNKTFTVTVANSSTSTSGAALTVSGQWN